MRVLELRMDESKDVEMKGLLHTLLLQKLLKRVPSWALNVFALEYGLRLSPRFQSCAFCASLDWSAQMNRSHDALLCPQAERDPTDGCQARRDAGAPGGDAARP